ncbi:hypothetical protein JTB14_030769 [Gonioctena quinquepunctata]|nr:hypothetical protein JTB14_030769 [Gonioctena quinquepunctata]
MDVDQPSTSKKKPVKPKRSCRKTTNASKFAKPDSDSQNEDSDSEKDIDNFFEWHSKIDFKPIKYKFDSQQSGHSVAGLRDTTPILEATEEKLSSADFQLELIRQILETYHNDNVQGGSEGRHSEDNPMKLSARHFPDIIPPLTYKAKPSKRCIVCSNQRKRKETRYMCQECYVPLCVVPCFKRYHTVKKF